MKRVTQNGKTMLTADEAFNRFDIEAWLIRRLGNPPSITAGNTTFAERQQRIADCIIERGWRDSPITSKGKQETFGQFYIRFYGESIKSKPAKGKEKHGTPA